MSRYYNCLMVLLTLLISLIPNAWGRQPCTTLAGLSLRETTIIQATLVPLGSFTPPTDLTGNTTPINLPAFCRVEGIIRTSTDSAIKFEVWMPLSGWNGKFQDVGNGGFAGMIVYRSMAGALLAGYATASTDDGHSGSVVDARWAIGHPDKVKDFGYRAVHETALISKTIIQRFYGDGIAQSYFNGCSDGGREALMEVQRFPEDFNGIIVGAPANNWTHQFAGFIWNEQATLDNPASYIPPSALPALQAAALSQCKTLASAGAGILEDPTLCHFDPVIIECKKGLDAPNCLTAPQVEAARKIYSGPRNPRTGKQIYPGYKPGAEADPGDWPAWITGAAPGKAIQFFFGNAFFSDMVFLNPKWDFRSFDFDNDIKVTDAKLGPILNATDPNLLRFRAHGGKMIQYAGWADSAVAPTDSINYYQTVVSFMKDTSRNKRRGNPVQFTQSFYRLFMVPGMGHCAGGPGATNFGNWPDEPPVPGDAAHNIVDALDRWIVEGRAPDKLVATKYAGDNPAKPIVRTQLLCPFPQAARWDGHGNRNDAANFTCVLPASHENGSAVR